MASLAEFEQEMTRERLADSRITLKRLAYGIVEPIDAGSVVNRAISSPAPRYRMGDFKTDLKRWAQGGLRVAAVIAELFSCRLA